MIGGVATQDLQVRYGDVVALSGLTIDLPVGTSLAVVGANGSGKSTLLGALAGLLKPSAGSSWTIDKPSFVLQSTEVDDGLPITVLDAVKLARYPSIGLFRRFGPADNTAVDNAMHRMNVTHLADMRLNELSGGQRQRVLMAQGLAQDSRVLLLDEPMSGLDMTSRQIVLDAIAEEVAKERTVITTTHSLADAHECDLVLLLATTPIAFGPPSEVLIESNLLNTFEGEVVRVGNKLIVDGHHAH